MVSEKATILAIETATSSCSVALLHSEEVYCRSQSGKNIHSQVVLSMIQEVLKEGSVNKAQIDAIAVDQGPGSFTGLRIGVGVAQGLAFALGCPMIAVTSLDILATQFILQSSPKEGTHIIAGIDARMSELYWCDYEVISDNELRAIIVPQVTRPESLLPSGKQARVAVGNAWSMYQGRFCQGLEDELVVQEEIFEPEATSLLHLAERKYQRKEFVNASEFRPFYVRNSVAKKSSKPLL